MVSSNGSYYSRNERYGWQQMIYIVISIICCWPWALMLLGAVCSDNDKIEIKKQNVPKSYRLLKARRHR